jgi:hypothetical protein
VPNTGALNDASKPADKRPRPEDSACDECAASDGKDEDEDEDDDDVDDGCCGSLQQQDVFASGVVLLLENAFKHKLTSAQAARIKAAFDVCAAQKPTVTDRLKDGVPNWYHDPVDDIDEGELDKMLLASLHCKSVDDIRAIRTHLFKGEHEQVFDDVIGLIVSGDAEKLLWALCPLKKAAANCTDKESRNNRSTKSINELYSGAKLLNFSQFCFRVIEGGKKTESCCSRFDETRWRKRIKMMQIKVVLLMRCCPRPPKVGSQDRRCKHPERACIRCAHPMRVVPS